jgi:predicted RNA binding protein YcfA (HicA-like mRNA interferase family)
MGDSDTIIHRLLKEGWNEVSHTGSHRTFKHPEVMKLITVPHPRKSLGAGLKRAIQRAAGWR